MNNYSINNLYWIYIQGIPYWLTLLLVLLAIMTVITWTAFSFWIVGIIIKAILEMGK